MVGLSTLEARDHSFALLQQSIKASFEASDNLLASRSSFQDSVKEAQRIWDSLGQTSDDLGLLAREVLVRVFKEETLNLATKEVDLSPIETDTFYATVRTRLDLILAFTHIGKCDDKAPYFLLDDIFGVFTVQGCEKVFEFLELRFRDLKLPLPLAQEKTTGLQLLRACNVLLSRLSKSQDALFCGRILSFMSSAFGLGARSGVNLRGDFNTKNETDFEDLQKDEKPMGDEEAKEKDVVMEEDEKADQKKEEDSDKKDEGEIMEELEEGETHDEETATSSEKAKANGPTVELKEPFYTSFWCLQPYFTNPSLLTTSSSTSATSVFTPTPTSNSTPLSSASSFNQFMMRLDRVLRTFSERTEREKVLRGTGDGSKKGKEVASREETEEDELSGLSEIFTAKFLTRPGLLDFELSDVAFRRQILVQALILLHFLRQFIPSEGLPNGPGKIAKTKMMDFSLDQEMIKSVNTMWEACFREINATWPLGNRFSKTMEDVLKKETRWSAWKDSACPPYDKSPLTASDLEEVRAKRIRLENAPAPRVQFALGTPALSELWEENKLTGLDQLENPRPLDEINSYATRLKREDLLASNRKRSLEKAGIAGPDLKTDDQLLQIEERKASLTFRAVRQATRSSLHLFSRVKPMAGRPNIAPIYVSMLLDAEKAEKEERAEKAAKELASVVSVTPIPEQGPISEAASPIASVVPVPADEKETIDVDQAVEEERAGEEEEEEKKEEDEKEGKEGDGEDDKGEQEQLIEKKEGDVEKTDAVAKEDVEMTEEVETARDEVEGEKTKEEVESASGETTVKESVAAPVVEETSVVME
ncbi:Nuclear matrix protein [Phaffia rhodozyma]|uniref:Nuclear matrix protein n=1 Tax=Phaffia rhodozyma TaxID=264483 RepID=A0A0F7SU71_PHARH|nr:Nuclear matrix protein [Phaffia rhodozyma]